MQNVELNSRYEAMDSVSLLHNKLTTDERHVNEMNATSFHVRQ